MGDKSRIEWTEATWNPVAGCSPVSEGCRNCYAARLAAGKLSRTPAYEGTAEYRGAGGKRRAVFNGTIRLLPDRLDQPLRWRRPRMIFVNSMSDLFHEEVPDWFIDQVFAVMALAGHHTYQVLTKRPERMPDYFAHPHRAEIIDAAAWEVHPDHVRKRERSESIERTYPPIRLPLPNVWLGTSVEDQGAADERIPHLLRTPAAVRFLSCEPLLGPMDLSEGGHGWAFVDELADGRRTGIHWIIAGGESGPGARPMHPDWVRSLRDQAKAAGVAYLFKQWGEYVGGHAMEIFDGRPGWCRFHNGEMSPSWDHQLDGETVAMRVGKKAAGRLLDGRTWDEFPTSR